MFCVPETVYRLILIAVLVVATGAPAAGQDCVAVVEVARLNLRETPDRLGRTLAVLTRGTRTRLIGRTPGWLKVSSDGKVGYLRDRAEYIRIVFPPAGPAVARDETIRRKAESIDRQIAQRQAEVVEITQQERDTIADLDTLDQHLSETRATLATLEAQMSALQEAIDRNSQAVLALKSETRQLQIRTSRRLEALYKLQWLGRVQVLAGAETVNDFLELEKALGWILASDEETLTRFAYQQERLAALIADQAEQQHRQAELKNEVDARHKTAAEERKRRRQILEEIQERKALELASIEALQKAAGQLDDTIGKLGRGPGPPKETAPSPDASFHTCKGLLKMPVNGRIVNFFGPYRNPRYNVINVRGGIDIRAEKGEPIRAVHGGRVLYADWFKGYGNMMIIDHGDAYYTVYAHAEELFKQNGAPVESGEVIATVGDTGSLDGAMLYFEVRHHGKPEDPLGWLKAS